MARYAIPVILACVYVAGAAWVVRNEGRSYRDSLRRATPEARTGPSAPAATPTDAEADRKPTPTAEPASPRPEAPAPAPISVAAAPPEKPEGSAPTPPLPPPPSSTPSPTPAAPARPLAKDAIPKVEQWKKDTFWNQDYLTKSWPLDHFSLEDERQLGQQLNALILHQNVQDGGPGLRRVKEAAKPLLDLVKPKEREYQFVVLDSDIPNAFSHPGGYVYVSRKLLEMIPEDQPALLEFVLGHEIAHVEAHHALACLSSPDVKRFSDGTLQKLYFLIIPYGYPDPFEYDADARAYTWMKQLHRTEHECRTFLRILDNYAKTHGFEHGRGKPEELLKQPVDGPKGDRTSTAIDNHLRSHPAAYDRLARLKALSAAPRP